MAGVDRLRVASVPAAHPYVGGLGLGRHEVDLLPDPPVPGAAAGVWWPPAMLDPAWIAAAAGRFDLLHVHFGMETRSAAELRAALDALAAAGRPLVYTAHDLSNPQLSDQSVHLAQLDLMFAAAAAVITLTPGAAAEIRARWHRPATVIAHPAVVSEPPPGPAPASAERAIGLHLRDLRPGIDGPGWVSGLLAALERLGDDGGGPVGVRVFMHDRVRDPGEAARVEALCAGSARASLHRGPRPDDRRLLDQVSALAVSALPYRHGTHSGWLEMCWDLGVPVLAPTVGHFAGQHPDPAFLRAAPVGDADGLARSLRALLAVPEARPGSSARRARQASRRAQRRGAGLGRDHLAVYRAVLSRAGAPRA